MSSSYWTDLKNRLSLKGKLLIAMSGMVLVSILFTGLLVNQAVFREVGKEITKKLGQGELTFESIRSLQTENMIQKGRMLTQIAFVKALISSKDPASIGQFAQDSLEKINSSVIIVTDENGNILSRTDSSETGRNLSAFAPVQTALEGKEGEGLFLDGELVYLLVTLPVQAGESVLGTISMGYRVDDDYAFLLKNFTGSDVSFMAEGKIVASVWGKDGRLSLERAIKEMGMDLFASSRGESGFSVVDVKLGGEHFSTIPVPLSGENDKTKGIFLIQTSKDKALGFFYNVRRLTILIGGIALLIAFWLSFVVARQVSHPMHELTETSMEIAKSGDLTREVLIHSEDEVGKLGASFNSMIGRLRNLMVRVRDAGSQINSKAAEITEGSTQQANGAAEQASTVTEVSTTVEELSQTAGQIAGNSENLSRASEETLKSIREIKSRVDTMSKKIFGLGDKSHAIGSITKVIDDLADRTNLLALNAAIEAARAGEAGHGFAVVAAEVGKLAERSTESTGEIRQLIAEIQAEVNSTIMGVEDTTKWTDKGLEMVGDTAQVTKEIYIATQQQKSAAEQVVEAMTNIDQVTTTFASTTKQTALAAKELNNLAHQLNTAISGFRLEKTGSMKERALDEKENFVTRG